MNLLKNFGRRKEPAGSLVGKIIKVGPYSVRVEALIGEGGFASIYSVRDNSTRTLFALKHFRLAGDADAIKDVQTEVDVMKRLRQLHAGALQRAGRPHRHPDIPGRLPSRVGHAPLAPAPRAQVGALLQFISHGQRQSNQQQRTANDARMSHGARLTTIWADVHCISCRDLKAENILLHMNGLWVLCDFGSSTARARVYESADAIMVEEDNIRKYTTPAYRAPEVTMTPAYMTHAAVYAACFIVNTTKSTRTAGFKTPLVTHFTQCCCHADVGLVCPGTHWH